MNTAEIFQINNNIRLLKLANTPRLFETDFYIKKFDKTFSEPINNNNKD